MLAVKVDQEAGVRSASEVTRRAECVQHAVVAEVGVAHLVGAGARGGEDAAVDRTLLDRVVDVLEDVALCNDLGAAADFESVALDLVPVIVDGVEEGVAADLGSTSGSVVDVVVLHGHQIARSSEVDGPVVVVVALGRPLAVAVNVAVADGHTLVGALSQDNVLATDASSLTKALATHESTSKTRTYRNMIDPDHISAIKRDCLEHFVSRGVLMPRTC